MGITCTQGEYAMEKTYLAIVSLQVVDIFKCSGWVNLDDIAMDSSKQMTAIAEWTLQTKRVIDCKFIWKQKKEKKWYKVYLKA